MFAPVIAAAVALLQLQPIAATTVSFKVDYESVGPAFKKPWTECVGSSHGSMSLREDWRQILRRVTAEIGFKRIRFHGILDDDMSVYLPNKAGPGKKASLYNIFSTFDLLEEIGMEPIVELSFMPLDLSDEPEGEQPPANMHYRGIKTPPKSWADWSEFITEVMSGVWERYKKPLIVETWNEPNCNFYVGSGCNQTSGNMTAYFKLYEETSKAVKAANPAFVPAGPVTAMLGQLDNFLTWAVDNGNAPVGIVSSHLYPTDPIINTTDRFSFVGKLREAAGEAEKRKLDFFLTEFNAGLGQVGEGRDSPYSAAFLGHLASSAQSLPENFKGMSFWTFTDVFEEQGLEPKPFHSGFGLTTNHGVNKPAYCAMSLLNDHGADTVRVSTDSPLADAAWKRTGSPGRAAGLSAGSVDVVATRTGSSSVHASVANFQPATYPSKPGNETVELVFTGLPAGSKHASVSVVDSSHCNPMTVWTAAGSPTYPSASLIQQMKEAGQPGMSQVPCSEGPTASTCTVTLKMEAFSFAMVSVAW